MKKTRNNTLIKYACLFLFGFLCSLINTYSVFAQAKTKTITGIVTEESNLPLIGASVSVKGTSVGTITDLDGKYSINVQENATLLFSYIGCISQTVIVKDKTVVNVTLREDAQALDEVVVVGYGVQKRSHLTGSISKVDINGLEDIPLSRVDQALQGRIAGVQIQNTTSEVGEAPVIRVRGMGSISASDSPLIITDGFPVEGGLEIINPNDIESIEVLKDAASSAIYGSRVANGVIMVTTKSGEIKKPKYSVKAGWGIKDTYKLHPIMTSQEYVQMRVNESVLMDIPLPAQDFLFLVLITILIGKKKVYAQLKYTMPTSLFPVVQTK
ncbi:TonB-dependent receptor SusC [termite gut metagenome]|uniref:TonB-dependent receptor SusC n=1 Tax=termite gut metagenome TaxID=433724 RepID=A0A5J4RS74_9ZZZZ